MYCNLHYLSVGDPGTGKTEIQKRSILASLKGTFVNCITATQSGILGTVTQNKFTGKYSIDGGVFKVMNPNGKVSLDELNRDAEHIIQKSILGIMADKKLNIHKANTRINAPCQVSIWATANPLKKYDNYTKGYDVFGIIEPLWDRFDFIVFYNNKLDTDNISKVSKLLMLKDNGSDLVKSISRETIELIKKHQIKAWTIEPKFSEEDYNKMALTTQEIYNKLSPGEGYRKLNSTIELLRGVCRLHHRTKPTDDEFIFINELIIELHTAKITFKQDSSD